mmetsp:Transcript_6647/g.5969  ORF Transcript_6647/g.5969 Transcript_6647/m.5969 type:complete len:327 (-) Transcript_6647:364-1344(-)
MFDTMPSPRRPTVLDGHVLHRIKSLFSANTAILNQHSHNSNGQPSKQNSKESNFKNGALTAFPNGNPFHAPLGSTEKKNIADCLGFDHLEIRNISEIDILHELEGIKSLTLHLANKCISEENYMQVCSAIRSQSGLKEIRVDLSNNTHHLQRDIIRELFSSINHSGKLQKLHTNIRVNNFSPLDTAILASSIYKLEYLIEVDILAGFNSLDNESINILFKSIANRTKLKKLRLDLQKIRAKNEGFKGIGKMLSELGKLRVLFLNLSDNKIEDVVLKEMATSLKALKELKSLDLSMANNLLKDAGVEAFATYLEDSMPELKVLGLDF